MDNKNSNKISIIVTVYKIKEEFLHKCIGSLLNQGRNDYEIIIIDDGSPDNCGIICDDYASNNPNISVIHQENRGFPSALNNGVKAVKTEWLTFVDADDWVENDYISTLYSLVNGEASNADIVMFDYIREYKNSQSKENLRLQTGFLSSDALEIVQRAPFYKLIQDGKLNPYTVSGIWDKMYKTEFIRKNDLHYIPEAKMGPDRLFNADSLNSTDNIYYLNKTLYHYRCWGGSTVNRYNPNIIELNQIQISELIKVIDKHELKRNVEDYFNCRVCTRLYQCMRLYCFNESNPATKREQLLQVKELAGKPPYKEALSSVKMNLLLIDEKVFVMLLKFRMYRLMYLIVKIKNRNKESKLS